MAAWISGRAKAMRSPRAMPLPVTSAMTMLERPAAGAAAGTGRRSRRRPRGPPRSGSRGRSPARPVRRSDTKLRWSRRPWASSTPTSGRRLSASSAKPGGQSVERRRRRSIGRSRGHSPRRVRRDRPRNGCPAPACRSAPTPSPRTGVRRGPGDRIAGHVDRPRPAGDPPASRRTAPGSARRAPGRARRRGRSSADRDSRQIAAIAVARSGWDDEQPVSPVRSSTRGHRGLRRRTAGPRSGVPPPSTALVERVEGAPATFEVRRSSRRASRARSRGAPRAPSWP